MAVQLAHKTLAETHDLGVALAFGVEVGASLASAQRQSCERILEDLLEAEKLEDGEVDGGVEAQTALVWANGAVKLDAVASIDVGCPSVVHPRHAEGDDAFGFDDSLQKGVVRELGVLLQDGNKRIKDLAGCLVELWLVRIALLELREDVLDDGRAVHGLPETLRRHRAAVELAVRALVAVGFAKVAAGF